MPVINYCIWSGKSLVVQHSGIKAVGEKTQQQRHLTTSAPLKSAHLLLGA